MPELPDAMYCHQQICIPPTYPYLLRQYAKAAIRSQPIDLLRWSSSYFRALAIGLNPPVKLRLEYPILCTHYGLTPGWLKTLIQQFLGGANVSWPQLHDRWRGICLKIPGLQEIIMMGGFEDPARIPLGKFIACAAGHLTANLTNTMILICELLTDEPEGGSAMIPYPTFAELYRFLAALDGCDERLVHNFFFTESNLDLTKKEESIVEFKEELLERSLISYMEEEATETIESIDRGSDLEKYFKNIGADTGEEDVPERVPTTPVVIQGLDTHSSCYIILDPEDGKLCREKHSKSESSEESSESSEKEITKVASKISVESAESEELYQFSHHSIEKTSEESSTLTMASSESGAEYVDFKLPVVPGIGSIVPIEMVQAVLSYLKDCANGQQGMVMPRNLKHFLCPPLEICSLND